MSFAEEFGHDIPPDDWDGGGRRSRYKHKPANYFTGNNPLFNTMSIKFLGVVAETNKAYLLWLNQGNAWVPKRYVTLDVDNLNVSLPVWLYRRLEYSKPK